MNKQKALQLRYFTVKLRQQNPDMTLQQIATAINRTRERVRQILVSEGIETRSLNRIGGVKRPNPLCRLCNTEIIIGTINKKQTHPTRKYCDNCISNNLWRIDMGIRNRRIPQIAIPCDYCKTLVSMRETLYKRQQSKYKSFFCSRSCRSKSQWVNQIIISVDGRIRRVKLGSKKRDD